MADLLPASDQASGLRRLFEKRAAAPVIAVLPTLHGGARLSDGSRVMMQIVDDFMAAGRSLSVLDEYPAPAGIGNAYSIATHKDLKHALRGAYSLDELAFSPAPGLTLIPASRAAAMEFTLGDEASLNGNLLLLRNRSECVMVDSAPRSGRALSPIAACADRVLVVVPAKAEDLPRAYGIIKRIVTEKNRFPVSIVVVRASDPEQARMVYERLRCVALEHLGVALHYQGAALTPGAPHLSLAPPAAIRLRTGDHHHADALWCDEEIADSMV